MYLRAFLTDPSLQSMQRPPASLPPTTASNPVSVSLILGSFEHSPSKFELFDLYLPESQPPLRHPDEPTFQPLPEIAHTFRPEQKVPPQFISTVFAALVTTPWIVLAGLVRLSYALYDTLTDCFVVGTRPSWCASFVLTAHCPVLALHWCL